MFVVLPAAGGIFLSFFHRFTLGNAIFKGFFNTFWVKNPQNFRLRRKKFWDPEISERSETRGCFIKGDFLLEIPLMCSLWHGFVERAWLVFTGSLYSKFMKCTQNDLLTAIQASGCSVLASWGIPKVLCAFHGCFVHSWCESLWFQAVSGGELIDLSLTICRSSVSSGYWESTSFVWYVYKQVMDPGIVLLTF